MSTHRYKFVKPVQIRNIDQQIAVGITAAIVGQSPDLTVDISLDDDAALTDLTDYMNTLGGDFVTSNPTDPRPTLATQYQPPITSTLNDPPGSPVAGDRYIVGVGTGDWAGHDMEIAEWDASATEWQFTVPTEGMTTWDAAQMESDVFSGTWEPGTPRELAVFNAADGILTAASSATPSIRNEREMLDYADGAVETVYFTGVVPRSYVAMGPLRAKIFWVAATATSGDVRWALAFERLEPGGPNVDSDNFGDNEVINSTTAVNGEINVALISFTNAEADAIKPGNAFRIRVRRMGGAAGDTMLGAAQAMRVVLVQ